VLAETLAGLAVRHGANKPPAYLDAYEDAMARRRNARVRLLELGIETGGSLLMWAEYFPHGRIAGLDRVLPAREMPDRVRMYEGSQDDHDLLDRIGAADGPFDFIVDDCSHRAEETAASFWHLFREHLRPGGIYAIEDWGTGYWPDFGDRGEGMVGFLKSLVDECGRNDRERGSWGGRSAAQSEIAYLTVFPGLAIVGKP
jgi:hypothetical protein